jgi:hypothetical protein
LSPVAIVSNDSSTSTQPHSIPPLFTAAVARKPSPWILRMQRLTIPQGQAIGLIIKVSDLISREDLTFGSSRFSAFAPRTFLFRGFIASDTTPKNYKDLNFESYSSCFLVPIETVRQRRKVSELTNLRLLTPSMKTRHESDYIFNLF